MYRFFTLLLFLPLLTVSSAALYGANNGLEETGKASARMITDYLKQNRDEKLGLWLPPRIQEHVKWVKTGEFKEVKEPILEVVGHRDAWRWVKRPTPSDPYRKVYEKYKQPIYKKVGERTVKREISKPSDEKSYISIHYRWYQHAINALPIYALIEGQVPPTDKSITPALKWYEEMLNKELPDNTVDLALSTLVLMKSNPKKYKLNIYRSLKKLIGGQLEQGKARGLWGNYCVNWQQLVFLRSQREKIDKYIEKLKIPDKIDEDKKKSKKLEDKLSKRANANKALDWLDQQERYVTSDFGLGRTWHKPRDIRQSEDEIEDVKKLWRHPRTFFDARLERYGEMIPTQIAIYTITKAHELGFLNKDFIEQFKDKESMVLKEIRSKVMAPPFPDYRKALGRTAAYLKKEQGKTGTWGYINRNHKHSNPYKDMRKMEELEFKSSKNTKNFKQHESLKLDDEKLYTFSAMHTLSLISSVVGKDTIDKKYKKTIEAGLPHIDLMYNDIVANPTTTQEESVTLFPFFFLYGAIDIHKAFEISALKSEDALKKQLEYFLKKQNEDGTFNKQIKSIFRSAYYAHPYLPREIRDRWFEKKWAMSWVEQVNINSHLLSNALVLLTYAKTQPELLKSKEEWPDVFEQYSELRHKHLGIKSDYIKKQEEEAAKRAAEEAAAKEQEAADKKDGDAATTEKKTEGEGEAPKPVEDGEKNEELGDIVPEEEKKEDAEDEGF